jgi:putative ubiquitin-RnfH superfamily antitoxin RatB of RatAB toxin-antitoxin module
VRVELLRAWPRHFERVELDLPAGSRVADALAAAGATDDPETVAYSVYGVRVDTQTVLRDGDRIEMLRPLQADPKDARRRRAGARRDPR